MTTSKLEDHGELLNDTEVYESIKIYLNVQCTILNALILISLQNIRTNKHHIKFLQIEQANVNVWQNIVHFGYQYSI